VKRSAIHCNQSILDAGFHRHDKKTDRFRGHQLYDIEKSSFMGMGFSGLQEFILFHCLFSVFRGHNHFLYTLYGFIKVVPHYA
jgi:hypothetical protein